MSDGKDGKVASAAKALRAAADACTRAVGVADAERNNERYYVESAQSKVVTHAKALALLLSGNEEKAREIEAKLQEAEKEVRLHAGKMGLAERTLASHTEANWKAVRGKEPIPICH